MRGAGANAGPVQMAPLTLLLFARETKIAGITKIFYVVFDSVVPVRFPNAVAGKKIASNRGFADENG